MGRSKRINIPVAPEVHERIRDVATETGMSQAEVMRRLMALYADAFTERMTRPAPADAHEVA